MTLVNMGNSETTKGYIYGLFAFGIWGLFPLYWHILDDVDAVEIIAHRALWTIPVCAIVLIWLKTFKAALAIFKQPKLILLLCLSTALIGLNWWVYIWSVTNDAIIQASIGYFLNPLVNVLIGLLLFKEHLRRGQWVAVSLAAIGVLISTVSSGEPPWIGLILAFSFGAYGAIRKMISVDSVPGLFIETLLVAPLALGYLIWLEFNGVGSFSNINTTTDLALMGAGIMTAVPLFSYIASARRLPISTVGMLFYITPSCLFLLATFLYDEPVTTIDLITFGFIWVAIAVFTIERQHNAHKNRETVI